MENWCCSCLASLKTSSKNFNEEINCGKKERRTKECKYIYRKTSHVQNKSMRVCSLQFTSEIAESRNVNLPFTSNKALKISE